MASGVGWKRCFHHRGRRVTQSKDWAYRDLLRCNGEGNQLSHALEKIASFPRRRESIRAPHRLTQRPIDSRLRGNDVLYVTILSLNASIGAPFFRYSSRDCLDFRALRVDILWLHFYSGAAMMMGISWTVSAWNRRQ